MLSICPRWASQQSLDGLFQRARLFSHVSRTTVNASRITSQRPFLSSITRYSTATASPEKAFRDRVQEVKNTCPEPYPRLTDGRSLSCSEFRSKYEHLADNETIEDDTVTVNDGHKVQVMCNQRLLSGVTPEEFKQLYRLLRRGDAFSVTGRPHRTGRGELTVKAIELPKLLSPCLHDIPVDAAEHETSPYARHIQFLADPKAADILRARSAIIQYLRQFFLDRSFMEVNTPIIAAQSGGAVAQPFYTSASEFPERQLSLRIAPELWLKRLVVGGFDKVFEIGPSFRNEGLDKTHNPEFTTCEFYHAYANLEDLMSMTESLISGMAAHVRELNEKDASTLKPTEVDFSTPFRRIDFIPGIEEAIGRSLPDLTSPEAPAKLKQLFEDLSLPIPENPTLPRLMDKLCSTYLEPRCQNPTFIINPPECLSPLSKSFNHPTNNQRVAARGELFIEGKEVVNTYEEENSPFEQRRKFQEQLLYNKAGNEPGEIDESYLQALEWGLPPTGGWGCGIDRLCMLFTGAKRIGDVLPFGNLRAVTRRHEPVSGHQEQES